MNIPSFWAHTLKALLPALELGATVAAMIGALLYGTGLRIFYRLSTSDFNLEVGVNKANIELELCIVASLGLLVRVNLAA